MLFKLISPAILQGKEEYIEIEIQNNNDFVQEDLDIINSQLIKRQDMVRLYNSITVNELDYQALATKENMEVVVELYNMVGWKVQYSTPGFFETGHGGALFMKQ